MKIETKYNIGDRIHSMTIRYISVGPTETYEYQVRWLDAEAKVQECWMTEKEIDKWDR